MTTPTQSPTASPDIRSAIFQAAKPKSKLVKLFGQDVELKQPSMGTMFEAQAAKTTALASAQMIIAYCYKPGTDEKVFDSADVEVITQMPWGKDLVDVQNAIQELTGIDKATIQAAIKNSDDDQGE